MDSLHTFTYHLIGQGEITSPELQAEIALVDGKTTIKTYHVLIDGDKNSEALFLPDAGSVALVMKIEKSAYLWINTLAWADADNIKDGINSILNGSEKPMTLTQVYKRFAEDITTEIWGMMIRDHEFDAHAALKLNRPLVVKVTMTALRNIPGEIRVEFLDHVSIITVRNER